MHYLHFYTSSNTWPSSCVHIYATIVKNWWSELAHFPLFRCPANAVFMNSYVTVLRALVEKGFFK